jgi:hypothetical protein
MKVNNESIRDQAIAAAGSIIGSGVGGLIGPEGMLLGGAAGSVGALLAAKTAPNFFSLDPIRSLLNNRKVATILQHKIDEDLNTSFVNSKAENDAALKSMRELISAASVRDPSISPLSKRLRTGFQWNLSFCPKKDPHFVKCLKALSEWCEKHGPIKIATTAVCAAAVAVLDKLNEQYSESSGFRVELSFDAINGRTLFENLLSKCDVDLALGPLEALVLVDEQIALPLKIIGPLFGEKQSIFVNSRPKCGFHSGIWVFERASAKFQYHVGVGVERNVKENPITNAMHIPDMVESIPPGDMVIAWSPLSSVLDQRRDYSIVRNSNYLIHFVLLGSNRVFAKKGFPLQEFLTVFIAEWRSRSASRNGLAKRLRSNHDFMTAFALSAGHRWVPEISIE